MNPYRHVTPDDQRARQLCHQAAETLRASTCLDEHEFPSQVLKHHYEALHAYLLAAALLDGIKTRGEGAHKDLITHAQNHGWITEEERALIDQLRRRRNALLYEGKPVKEEFLQARKEAIQTLLVKLRRTLADALTAPSRPSG